MAEGWEPYGITTEAGKALFTQMNMEQGSAVWGPVGEGIVEVEKEVTERVVAKFDEQAVHHRSYGKGIDAERKRIIALLVNAIIDSEGYCHADTVIALIKGENE